MNKAELQLITDQALIETLFADIDDNDTYSEFLRRFRKDLAKLCRERCAKYQLEPVRAAEFTNDAFERFRKSKTFRTDKIAHNKTRAHVLAYLNRIASNLIITAFKKEQPPEVLPEQEGFLQEIFRPANTACDPADLAQHRDLVLQVFASLNAKEKQVIVHDIEHKRFSKYLPDDTTEELAQLLNVQKATLRKIRQRASEKIKTKWNEITRG